MRSNEQPCTADKAGFAVRNEPGYEKLTGHDEVVTKYMDKRAELLVQLKRFARREFQ